MAGFKSYRFIFGLALVLLALPAMAAAQSSTFVTTFERVGTPGTGTVVDPVTGQTVIVDTGAFVNPCTSEFVDVRGTSTISILQTIDKFGTRKVDVSEVIKGTGAGWVLDVAGLPIFTASTYSFNESQSFSFKVAANTAFSSDFSDKLSMKGAKSIDNWIIRARFRIKVNADGTVQVFSDKMTAGDVCRG